MDMKHLGELKHECLRVQNKYNVKFIYNDVKTYSTTWWSVWGKLVALDFNYVRIVETK